MQKNIKIYLLTLLIFLLIDLIWLALVAPEFYADQIGYLLAERANYLAALIFYLLFVGGLVVFVLKPALQAQSLSQACLQGALFGLVTYATYDLTNLATIQGWPLAVTLVDLAWGTSLSLLVSVLAYLAIHKLRFLKLEDKHNQNEI